MTITSCTCMQDNIARDWDSITFIPGFIHSRPIISVVAVVTQSVDRLVGRLGSSWVEYGHEYETGIIASFYCAMLCIARTVHVPSQDVCPSVCLSVCRVRLSHAGILLKRLQILKLFSALGTHTIQVFPYQTVCQY